MIVFEEKAFDENRVTYASIKDNFNSKKVYCNSSLDVYFTPDSVPSVMDCIEFHFPTHDQAITKMNELVSLINARKDAFLKVQR